eukprot:s172_g4.t1
MFCLAADLIFVPLAMALLSPSCFKLQPLRFTRSSSLAASHRKSAKQTRAKNEEAAKRQRKETIAFRKYEPLGTYVDGYFRLCPL